MCAAGSGERNVRIIVLRVKLGLSTCKEPNKEPIIKDNMNCTRPLLRLHRRIYLTLIVFGVKGNIRTSSTKDISRDLDFIHTNSDLYV